MSNVTKQFALFNTIEDFETWCDAKKLELNIPMGVMLTTPIENHSMFDSRVMCIVTNQMGDLSGLTFISKEDADAQFFTNGVWSKIEGYNEFKKSYGNRILDSFTNENIAKVLSGGTFSNAMSNNLWSKFKRVVIPANFESLIDQSIYREERVVNIFDQLKAGSLESAFDAMALVPIDDFSQDDHFFDQGTKDAFLNLILAGIQEAQGYLA